jgi:hypothetical protein
VSNGSGLKLLACSVDCSPAAIAAEVLARSVCIALPSASIEDPGF